MQRAESGPVRQVEPCRSGLISEQENRLNFGGRKERASRTDHGHGREVIEKKGTNGRGVGCLKKRARQNKRESPRGSDEVRRVNDKWCPQVRGERQRHTHRRCA